MTKKELAEGIHQVEDRLVAEAEHTQKCGRRLWQRYRILGTAAAAVVLMTVVVFGFLPETSPKSSSSGDSIKNGNTGENDNIGGNGTVGKNETDEGESTTTSAENGEASGKSYQEEAVALATVPESCPDLDSEKWIKWQEQCRKEYPVEDSFYASLQEFAFQTTSACMLGQKERREHQNVLYSPLSLYYALAVVAEGAAGETKEELLQLLAVSDAKELAEQCGNLYRCFYQDNEESSFQIANSLWMAESYLGSPILWKQNYLNMAVTDFYASLFSVDFKDTATYQHMSDWVSDQTNGLLRSVLAPVQPGEEALEQIVGILNTIYIKDRWRDCFYEEFTREEDFTLADGASVKALFMNQAGSGDFFTGDGFVRAELKLERLGSMVFVLPEEGVSPEEFLSSPERLAEVFTGGRHQNGEIIWKVPKFTFGMTQELDRMLRLLGVEKAFDRDNADFSNMIDTSDGKIAVSISQVKQGTRLIVEEGGIEAAAYTYIAENRGAGEPLHAERAEMILDRPFLYAIVRDGVYTFIGVCQNPTMEE